MADRLDINIEGTPEQQVKILTKELRKLKAALKAVTKETKKYKMKILTKIYRLWLGQQ